MIFVNRNSITIPLTKVPVNQADREATHMVIKGIIPEDITITGSLYKDDILLTENRVFTFKNMPFVLSDEQKKFLATEVVPEQIDSLKNEIIKISSSP